jgi:hypothetical protein
MINETKKKWPMGKFLRVQVSLLLRGSVLASWVCTFKMGMFPFLGKNAFLLAFFHAPLKREHGEMFWIKFRCPRSATLCKTGFW